MDLTVLFVRISKMDCFSFVVCMDEETIGYNGSGHRRFRRRYRSVREQCDRSGDGDFGEYSLLYLERMRNASQLISRERKNLELSDSGELR